jgi:hypothetical protein
MLELRNGQRKPKDSEMVKTSSEHPEANLFSQLSKDLNQDNLHYINSLLKGRSTSHSQGDLQLKKPALRYPDLEEAEKVPSRAKSFFDKPPEEETKTVQKPSGSLSLVQMKCVPTDERSTYIQPNYTGSIAATNKYTKT